MTTEEKLKRFESVNSCETLMDLANTIRQFADEDGMIQGRTKKFNAERMAKACENYGLDYFRHNTLTREFGIRQQAMMIHFYNS